MLALKKGLVKAKQFIFPTDKETTPKDHANAILLVLNQFEPDVQSDILKFVKEGMIKDRKDTIVLYTADLEKLQKI